MRKFGWFILIFFFFKGIINAQENYQFKGYVKGLSSLQFLNNSKSFFENNFHNRMDFDWYASQNLTFTAGLRNRIIFGSLINQIPNYAYYFGKDSGFLDLSSIWLNKKSVVGITQLDRLFLDYTVGKIEISIGKQRINWGQAFVWNPNDLFNNYSYFDFDYEEKPGSDALRLQYYVNETSKLEWATSVNRNKIVTSALLYKWNSNGYDFQILTGVYKQTDWVIGTGWSGSIARGSFNGELTYFKSINSSENKNKLTAVIHYDYTFKNSLSLQFETLYNGFSSNNTNTNITSFTLIQANPKNLFPSNTTFFGSASYNVSPLLTAILSGMVGNSGNFLYVGPTITYSLSNNKELTLIGQFYELKEDNISFQPINNGGSVFVRLKWAF